MAYTVNWQTRVVSIPKTDLTLVTASPEVYNLDLDTFRLAVRAIEASEAGIVFQTEGQTAPNSGIIRHTPPSTFGNTTLARVVSMINTFKVEFEDGQYTVEIIGGNSNFNTEVVRNQVSIATNNSAGIVQVTSGSGLSAAQATQLEELWKLAGLDDGNPVFIPADEGDITVGDITIDVSGDCDTGHTLARE